jgi:hypothetical protein
MPDRALQAVASGMFANVSKGDVVWILTSQEGKIVLALRFEAGSDPVQLRKHPPYAVGNSKYFFCYQVMVADGGVKPSAIPMSMDQLRRLTFTSTSRPLTGPLNKLLTGPLAVKKPLAPKAVPMLEKLWTKRQQYPWYEITVRSAGQTVFASAAHRSRVEKAAIKKAKEVLTAKGWAVVSRERDRVGYDLHCTKGKRELHVEVKGTAGSEISFFLTRNELLTAKTDRDFRLLVVAEALSAPKVRTFTGPQMQARFEIAPIAYQASEKLTR